MRNGCVIWLRALGAKPVDRSGGAASLVDRRSVRRTQRRTLDPSQQQQAMALRHERCTMRRIAKNLAAPLSTVGRWLKT